MPKIVLLDSATLGLPEDIQSFKDFGEFSSYERTRPHEIVQRAKDAEIIITNKCQITKEIMVKLPRLRYIGELATGVNNINLAYAKSTGIAITNVPAYSTKSVAQQVFALLLELTNSTGLHSDSVHKGDWEKCPDFCYWLKPPVELSGKTFGIIGYGSIGQEVEKIARSLGMDILASTRHPEKYRRSFVSTEEIFKKSDVVSIHTPLTEETKGMVDKKLLSAMKPTAYLINTSRGPVINEKDLADALNRNTIAGAGLDVLSTEPPKDNPLLSAKNCIITPHISWASTEARKRLLHEVKENLRAFLEGKIRNVL